MTTAASLPYVIARTSGAGVYAGELVEFDRVTSCARLTQARRLWRWRTPAPGVSLSDVAVRGIVSAPTTRVSASCDVLLTQVHELIAVTPEARATIEAHP